MPFSKEIRNKSLVTLYDNQMKKLYHGTISGYKDKPACIIVNKSVYYPVHQVAKIEVHSTYESQYGRTSTRLQV